MHEIYIGLCVNFMRPLTLTVLYCQSTLSLVYYVYSELVMHGLNIGTIPSYAFSDVSVHRLYLESSAITTIEEFAFNSLSVSDDM